MNGIRAVQGKTQEINERAFTLKSLRNRLSEISANNTIKIIQVEKAAA